MDKQFWASIQENDYQVTEGHDVSDLKEELYSYIGSTDAELRDTIGLEVFYNWLTAGHYSMDDIRDLIPRLTANLQQGLGETETDSVFLRSFSALWLSCILEYDNQKPQLQAEDILSIFEPALAYLPAERDLRGLVPEKGWAHAVAHGADVFWRLAGSLHTNADHHSQILDCIADGLNEPDTAVYLYSEDCRLARAAIEIFKRNTLSIEQIQNWLTEMSAPWNGAWASDDTTLAFFNARNFIRCLHWQMGTVENITEKEAIMGMLRETLNQAKPWEVGE
jgi:hypothetical protein